MSACGTRARLLVYNFSGVIPMRHLIALIVSGTLLLLASCQPITSNTPNAPGGTTQACAFQQDQSAGLTMNCTITGPIANIRLDPGAPDNPGCSLLTWTVFGQTISAPITVIYGENNDENSERVRVGVSINNGTHSGSLAKDDPVSGCNQHIGPTFAVATSYAGTYTALVDKSQTPICVFQSRLNLPTYNQTLTAGIAANISELTRSSIQNSLQRRIDLEIATTVNGLLQPASVSNVAGATDSGRCNNGWQAFSGN
jgi:hypothetical protein